MAARTGTDARPLVLLALAVGFSACRDGAAPYRSADRPDLPDTTVWRLTYGPTDDRAPAWAPDGDTIYYSAEQPGPVPRVSVLTAIPRDGGVARPLLGPVQRESAGFRWLLAPTPAPGAERIAYVERWEHRLKDLCFPRGTGGTLTECEPLEWEVLTPILMEVRIRVRDVDALTPVEQDPTLAVPLDHYDLDRSRRPYQLEGVHVHRDHPFHVLSRTRRTAFYRPSWGPQGRRLVFSDGLGLEIWEVGEATAARIPGTDDGISAAWSPDGEWIAFTRLERGDPSTTTCIQYVLVAGTWVETCVVEQVRWPILRRTLSLVRPDGSERVDLGEGEQPAWGPGSRFLYFRKENRLWRVEVTDAAAAMALPDTYGGHEPAVSPDGQHLAFVRRTENGPGDIWVLRLTPEG